MIRALLGPRRIWWFFTDMKIYIHFSYDCPYCGQMVGLRGQGFTPLNFYKHNPICKHARFYNLKQKDLRWNCLHCWKRGLEVTRFWIVQRWHYRKKYNWGVE